MTLTTEQATLRQMIDGYRVSKIICVAAELRLADHLANGPKDCEELARASKMSAPALYRLLRALASVGVLAEVREGRFAATPRGDLLRQDAPGSLRAWAVFSRRMYRNWAELDHSIATGETAFDLLHGMDAWSYRAQNQEEERVFNDAMSALVALLAQSVATSYDFSRFGTIVDVGGGQGALLMRILQVHSAARGILFDVPGAIREAPALLDSAGVGARCEFVAGSFFDSVPAQGDVYILSRVLHDWDDARVAQILTTLRRSMQEGKTLLVIERVLDPDKPTPEATLSDLNMMVSNGGRERTEREYSRLLAAGGFKLAHLMREPAPFHILEAAAV